MYVRLLEIYENYIKIADIWGLNSHGTMLYDLFWISRDIFDDARVYACAVSSLLEGQQRKYIINFNVSSNLNP